MKKRLSLLLLLSFGFTIAQKPIFTNATVKSATVYSYSAELSQTTSIQLPTGTSEIVVKNVADYLNENTVQIAAPNSVTVLSVQFTKNYISEYETDENNPILEKVRDSIKIVEIEISKVVNQRNSYAKSIEILDKNQQISSQNSNWTVSELMKLVDYTNSKRTELSNLINTFTKKEQDLTEKLAQLNQKLEINVQEEEKTSKGKLIIQVMNEVAGLVKLDINYITNNASWTPFYDLRADNTTLPITMMYKAKVAQNTGIDWKKVKLTLSNGNPNQNNQAPELNTWFLRYRKSISSNFGYIDSNYFRDGDHESRYDTLANGKIIDLLQGRASGVNITQGNGSSANLRIRGTSSINSNAEPLIIINGTVATKEAMEKLNPNAIKNVTVLKEATALYGSRASNGVLVITTKNMDDYTFITEKELNVSFDIDIPYDILSNGKVHSVALKELKLPANYRYYAAPRIDKDVFLTAEIIDYSKFNILPGEANIIFEGLYVGKTTINPSQTSDSLQLSMGRDKKIVLKREKVVEKSGTRFLSSYKEQTFTYDITVRNNKNEAIQLIMEDQYPISTDKEITIELLEKDNAKVNQETGILTWYLNLGSNETKKIRMSYKVRYPKDKTIENL
jgi:TonB-dependent SusC/RagA subfamily outer membrane receptor